MSNPFKNYSNIQIILQRNENKEEDDCICIVPGNKVYDVYYRDGHSTYKKTYQVTLTSSELDIYIDSLFSLLVRDGEPFQSIQFSIPCFPTVLYDIQDLRKGKLRNAVKQAMVTLQQAEVYSS